MAVICMTGEWHQAVVVAAALAEMGHEVRGATTTEDAASRLNAATPPVHEPGLPELLAAGAAAGRLRFTSSWRDALRGAEFVYIAIDTPIRDDDTPDLASVTAAAERIGDALDGDITLVVTAQVPVGTCERLRGIIAERSGRTVHVAHVPEFLRLGQAIETFVRADRFIIGADDVETATRVEALYAPLDRPLLRMDLRSAEMAKHASNAFLAASISFANEIADLCAAVGADIDHVTAGMKLDRRIGPWAFLSAGLGFAGGTLGRDLRALQAIGAAAGAPTHLVDATLRVNESRAGFVRRQLAQLYGSVEGLHVGVLGLTYKPGTSTMRRSIALDVIRELVDAGAQVTAFDPLADMDEVSDAPAFERAHTAIDAVRGADAAVLITEWDGIDELDATALRQALRRPVFIDTRNRMDADALSAAGIHCIRVGRRTAGQPGAAVEVLT